MHNISFSEIYQIIYDRVHNSNMDHAQKHNTIHLLAMILCNLRNTECIIQIDNDYLPTIHDLSPDLMNNFLDKIIIEINTL